MKSNNESKLKIIGIIQARMGSTRLPGKVLMELKQKSVLKHVYERTSSSKFIEKVYIATTINDEDLAIVNECGKENMNVFCGSENDVLDRYFQLAKLIKPDLVVRITADCPAIDPNVIDLVIADHIKKDCDYSSNTLVIPFPDGQDVEVFTYKSLEIAWKKAKLISEREHVTPFIKLNEKDFKINKVLSTKELSNLRWTLDEKEDFEVIKIIFNALYDNDKHFTMGDIIALYNKEKKLFLINQMHTREEGYRKSLQQDKLMKEI